MKTDLDEIIKKVAVRNGAGLRKDDAVIQLVTVIDSIMENHTKQLAEKQQELLTVFAEKTEATLNRINAEMKENSVRSVNAAANYAKDMLPRVLTEGANEAVRVTKGELTSLLRDMNDLFRDFQGILAGTKKIAVGACIIITMVGLLVGFIGIRMQQ